MPVKPTEKIWHNGKFIPWKDATLHVMSHVVNYGSSVFEGIRCYAQPKGGGAIFRATEHAQRLLDSAKIYRIDVDYTREELVTAMLELVRLNRTVPCYIRPIVLRGYGEVGVNPLNSPVDVYIANYEWGKYLGSADEGADVCVSSWNRLAPNTMPTMSKSGANYMNSQLIKMEAIMNGYVEGIALDVNGYVSEGSGENVFVVRHGAIYTGFLTPSSGDDPAATLVGRGDGELVGGDIGDRREGDAGRCLITLRERPGPTVLTTSSLSAAS